MHKFPITNYTNFSELPLDQLNALRFSVYILDFNWCYLFVNDFVKANLGSRGNDLIGKNMWQEFNELARNPSFSLLKKNMEKKIVTNIETVSPLNFQRLKIIGYPLADCYYFTASILPDKADLIHELRNVLWQKNNDSFKPDT